MIDPHENERPECMLGVVLLSAILTAAIVILFISFVLNAGDCG